MIDDDRRKDDECDDVRISIEKAVQGDHSREFEASSSKGTRLRRFRLEPEP